MNKPTNKEPDNAKVLEVAKRPDQTQAQAVAWVAVNPETNAAFVIDAFQSNTVGNDVNLTALIEALRQSTGQSKAGDLSQLEAMLISQATALQAIFTSFARRATNQKYQQHLESFMGMALKAQAQSRATISALVDLKYPRQATFVKQANIANGPQQVNNTAHAGEIQPPQNKLLEAQHGNTLDIGATATAGRADQALETVGAVHRA